MAISINQSHSSPIQIGQKSTRRDEYIPQDYKNVAEGMESQFAEYMIGEMKKTINKDEENPESQADEIYQGFLGTEQAKAMANGDRLGIKKLILDQIYPEQMRTKFAYEQFLNREKAKREMINPNAIKVEKQESEIKMHDPSGQGGLK